jgi:hypothetical protein
VSASPVAPQTNGEPFLTRFDGPAPEQEVAGDLVRRGLYVAPVLLLGLGLPWGWQGVASVAYGLGLVLVNFLLAAGMLAWAARVSIGLMMGAALGGFLVRMALIALAVLAVVNVSWIEIVPLGITIAVTHVGLLFWETRHVSASLAYPGLKPRAPKPAPTAATKE